LFRPYFYATVGKITQLSREPLLRAIVLLEYLGKRANSAFRRHERAARRPSNSPYLKVGWVRSGKYQLRAIYAPVRQIMMEMMADDAIVTLAEKGAVIPVAQVNQILTLGNDAIFFGESVRCAATWVPRRGLQNTTDADVGV